MILYFSTFLTVDFQTTHELAHGTRPPTCNAFDINRGAGGSSIGSAVAVADYQCHVALGTQTVSWAGSETTFAIFGC